jgi:hypothetical protein
MTHRNWVNLGIVWLSLLGISSGVAIVGRRQSSASPVITNPTPAHPINPVPVSQARSSEPAGYVPFVPPYDPPTLSFAREASDKLIDSSRENLEAFAKSLQNDMNVYVVIQCCALSANDADRQTATDRAKFVTDQLAQLGVASSRILSNELVVGSVVGVKFKTFKLKK